MTANVSKRKMVDCGRKRVPLRKLFHGKEIRDAAAALEEFRLHLNEAEFLYGAKITLQMDAYGECIAVAKRPETDSEYNTRLEKVKQAAIAKAERERLKAIADEAKKAKQAEDQKKRTLEHMQNLAKQAGITKDELKTLVESMLT